MLNFAKRRILRALNRACGNKPRPPPSSPTATTRTQNGDEKCTLTIGTDSAITVFAKRGFPRDLSVVPIFAKRGNLRASPLPFSNPAWWGSPTWRATGHKSSRFREKTPHYPSTCFVILTSYTSTSSLGYLTRSHDEDISEIQMAGGNTPTLLEMMLFGRRR